jgi:hypothetical protein
MFLIIYKLKKLILYSKSKNLNLCVLHPIPLTKRGAAENFMPPLSHAFIARSKSMNVCRPKKKKSPATQPRFWLPRTTPGFPARNIYRASSAQIQKSSVGLQTPTPAATQLLAYPLQPCIARTSQLHPFSSVSSSALGHAPPTDSHRRSLAGASTHRFGSSRPARVVVALLHRRAISSCGGRFSGAGGTCEG